MRTVCALLASCLVFTAMPIASAADKIAKTLDLDGYEVQFVADPEIPFTDRLRVNKDEQEV